MRSQRAIGLIEVVVVILILGVLAAVFLPYLAASREIGHSSRCASNVKQLLLACALYAGDHNEAFPNAGGDPMASLGLLFPDYMNNGEVFVCSTALLQGGRVIHRSEVPPGETSAVNMFTADNTDYGYDPDHTSSHAADVAIIADKGTGDANSPNHDGEGQNVGYVGGNVGWYGGPYGGDEGFYAGHEEDSIYTPGYKGSPAKVKAGVKVTDKRLHSYIRHTGGGRVRDDDGPAFEGF